MNHIVRYESYSIEDRLNDILDKISTYGTSNLTNLEMEFLNSYQDGNQVEIHNKVKFLENEFLFEDDFGRFRFEYKNLRKYKNSNHYNGTIYINDCGKQKCLHGKIIEYPNGTKSLNFTSSSGEDIFEFCSGIECELDNFIDYVVAEINDKKI